MAMEARVRLDGLVSDVQSLLSCQLCVDKTLQHHALSIISFNPAANKVSSVKAYQIPTKTLYLLIRDF